MLKKRFLFSFFFLACLATSTPLWSRLKIKDLRCEMLEAPLAIDNTRPRLSWKIWSHVQGERCTAWQILAASSPELLNEKDADLWNSGKVNSKENNNVAVYDGKTLAPRSLIYWKVRVWNEDGKKSAWSKPSEFGIGMLNETDWNTGARFIGKRNADAMQPSAPLLRKRFTYVPKNERVLLHVNSLGYHEAYLNGLPVSDAVLSPAVSQHGKRSLIVTYDVTPLMKRGENELVLWIGRGWYQTFASDATHAGPYVRAQLDAARPEKTHTLVVTDPTWLAAESGRTTFGTWRPHQMGGETVDARTAPADLSPKALQELVWETAEAVTPAQHIASPQMCEPNRRQQSFHPVAVRKSADSAFVYDMGHNFVGFTKVMMPAVEKGMKIEFHYDDFHVKENGDLREGLYTDYYIGGGEQGVPFESKFNYKGYRYLKVKGLAEALPLEDITGSSVRTDYGGDVSFTCSDNDMNAIFNMIKHTLQALTLGGDMVDCPQIERLGYGGDGNASTPTLQSFFNVAPLYMNWMQAWADSQQPDGGMPHTAPNPYSAGGGPYWCGFIITASWQTYLNYGDKRLLERYYPNMQKWLEYAERHHKDGLLKQWPNTSYRNWYLGDWATPSGIDQTDNLSVDLVNNCFLSDCYSTMEKIAKRLNRPEEATSFKDKQSELNRRIHHTFYRAQNRSYSTGTQIDLVYPMLVGATPKECTNDVKATLFKETEERFKGHLSTGLVGIPVITQWATQQGEADFMYGMLKKRDYPSYLYMLDNGATTTWEHWDGQRSHIHNCYNGIGSWFIQALAGINPDETNPGYRHAIIRPQMPDGIDWVKAEKDTPNGMIKVWWNRNGDETVFEITIPTGSNATLIIPKGRKVVSVDGKKESAAESLQLNSGKHKVVCSVF